MAVSLFISKDPRVTSPWGGERSDGVIVEQPAKGCPPQLANDSNSGSWWQVGKITGSRFSLKMTYQRSAAPAYLAPTHPPPGTVSASVKAYGCTFVV